MRCHVESGSLLVRQPLLSLHYPSLRVPTATASGEINRDYPKRTMKLPQRNKHEEGMGFELPAS
jgi:hypothetical protein